MTSRRWSATLEPPHCLASLGGRRVTDVFGANGSDSDSCLFSARSHPLGRTRCGQLRDSGTLMSERSTSVRRNERLWWWIHRTGLSYAAFARELWMTAELNGRSDLRPDRTRIGHWVNDGQTPQHPMPDYLAQTLSRLSGCTVTVADLGLSHGPQPEAEHLGVVDVATAFSRSVVSTDLSPLYYSRRSCDGVRVPSLTGHDAGCDG